jgi:hypothetical protein
MEVLHRALRQVLTSGDRLCLYVTLCQDAANTALAQFNGQAKTYGTSAVDHDICNEWGRSGVGHMNALLKQLEGFAI